MYSWIFVALAPTIVAVLCGQSVTGDLVVNVTDPSGGVEETAVHR